jgi:hypothetical protein
MKITPLPKQGVFWSRENFQAKPMAETFDWPAGFASLMFWRLKALPIGLATG